MDYSKPPLSYQQQLDCLIERGLQVSDSEAALHALERISYYRLSGYWLPFKCADDGFEPDASFDAALALYEFDRRFRLLVMDAIERIEISLRNAITHELAFKYGTFAHTDSANFWPKFRHAPWLLGIEAEAVRSHEVFIKHYQQKYEGFPQLPVWMALEVVSLGALSKLYSGMHKKDQSPIAAAYGVRPPVLRSWLHTLTYVRNVCAHHSRLWNRELRVPPQFPNRQAQWDPPHVPHNDRVWVVMLILRTLMDHHHQGGDWQTDIERLIEPYVVEKRWRYAMGFPYHWREHPAWNVNGG